MGKWKTYKTSSARSRDVTRCGGARGKKQLSLAPPCSNLRSFGSKCTVLKKVLVTLLGLGSAPHSHPAPGELCLLPRHYAHG